MFKKIFVSYKNIFFTYIYIFYLNHFYFFLFPLQQLLELKMSE